MIITKHSISFPSLNNPCTLRHYAMLIILWQCTDRARQSKQGHAMARILHYMTKNPTNMGKPHLVGPEQRSIINTLAQWDIAMQTYKFPAHGDNLAMHTTSQVRIPTLKHTFISQYAVKTWTKVRTWPWSHAHKHEHMKQVKIARSIKQKTWS